MTLTVRKDRTRKTTIQNILNMTYQRFYDSESHPFCFEVKLYRLNLTLPNLLYYYRKEQTNEAFTYEKEWLTKVQERFDAFDINLLQEEARASAAVYFVGYGLHEGPTDMACTLRDGRQCSGVEYRLVGRSEGWLSLTKFEGYDFTKCDDVRSTLDDMPYPTLRKLYHLLDMVRMMTQNNNPQREVEYQASYIFFQQAH